VAAEARVGVGTLYRHYPTREALLSAQETKSYELVLSAARRAARIYLVGLAPGRACDLPGAGLTRADLEAGFSATPSR
jgi:AcrR family transcriptional regulator